MTRKRIVSGPIHGPVRERQENRGAGRAVPRSDAYGRAKSRNLIDDGFPRKPGSTTGAR